MTMSGIPNRAADLTGHRYGMLTVLSFHSRKCHFLKWNCRCDCGKECIKYGHQIRAGKTTSCGCEASRKKSETGKRKALNLMGKRFGRLVVLERVGSNKYQKSTWRCLCDCGKEKIVVAGSLVSGNTTTCGCFQKETMHRIRWNPNKTMEERRRSRNRDDVPATHLWRKAVRKRDGCVCQVCGTNDRQTIVAHHLDSWKENPEKRFVVDNGVTTCWRCHCDFHSQYGYGKNTKQQWEEFLCLKKRKTA